MPRIYSSRQVGKMMSADPSSVNRWIDSGRLKAYRTPGGHRRVLHEDLIGFLKEWSIPLPDELKTFELSLFLVDDDEQYLRSLRKALLRNDRSLKIQTCSSSIEALIQLGTLCPDVILLDIFMPGLDGVEVCQRIKSNERTKDIIVVANTGRPSPSLEKRVLDVGAEALLIKPFKPGVFLDLIRPAHEKAAGI